MPAPSRTSWRRYVALGDSYSAASGVTPSDPTAPLLCLRSTRNYPHVIAAATGASAEKSVAYVQAAPAGQFVPVITLRRAAFDAVREGEPA